MRQQHNKESKARNRENETVEDTQLQQTNREVTARSRANESSEATIDTNVNDNGIAKGMRKSNRKMFLISLATLLAITAIQVTTMTQNWSSIFLESTTKHIPPSERREFGHTLNPDAENDETFNPLGHCGALILRKIPWCTHATAETGKGFCCDNFNVEI